MTFVDEYEEDMKAMRVRCHRAVLTLCAIPQNDRLGFAKQWAIGEVVRSKEESYGYEVARRKFQPTPKDVTDMMRVMSAMAMHRKNSAYGDRDFKIIWARAFDVPWWKIGEELGIRKSDRTISRMHDDAVVEIFQKILDTFVGQKQKHVVIGQKIA